MPGHCAVREGGRPAGRPTTRSCPFFKRPLLAPPPPPRVLGRSSSVMGRTPPSVCFCSPRRNRIAERRREREKEEREGGEGNLVAVSALTHSGNRRSARISSPHVSPCPSSAQDRRFDLGERASASVRAQSSSRRKEKRALGGYRGAPRRRVTRAGGTENSLAAQLRSSAAIFSSLI